MSTTTPPKLLLTADECAAWLNVGSGVLDRWVSEGMPCLYTGGEVGHRRFHPDLVDEWVRKRAKQARRGEAEDQPPKQPRRGRSKAAEKRDGAYNL